MYKKYNRFKKLIIKIIKREEKKGRRKEKKKKKKKKRKTPQNCKSPVQRQRFITTIKYVTEYTHTNTAAKSPQSVPTLCDPIDSSPPGSPIPGTLQARTLEWVAMSFSNA